VWSALCAGRTDPWAGQRCLPALDRSFGSGCGCQLDRLWPADRSVPAIGRFSLHHGATLCLASIPSPQQLGDHHAQSKSDEEDRTGGKRKRFDHNSPFCSAGIGIRQRTLGPARKTRSSRFLWKCRLGQFGPLTGNERRPQCFSDCQSTAAVMRDERGGPAGRVGSCRVLEAELEVTSNLETEELRSNESAEYSDAVHRDHGDGKDLNHDYIHLDKKHPGDTKRNGWFNGERNGKGVKHPEWVRFQSQCPPLGKFRSQTVRTTGRRPNFPQNLGDRRRKERRVRRQGERRSCLF